MFRMLNIRIIGHCVFAALLLPVVLLLTGCNRKSNEPVFNVPALLGKKIDEVQSTLNLAPVEAPLRLQPIAVEGEEYRTFKKDDWYLVVAYRTINGRVQSFLLGTDEGNGSLKEKERFLLKAKLREDDALYRLDFVEASDTVFSYTGVKITPEPINHEVVFRLTGSEDVFYMNYSVRPVSGPEQANKMVTVPPWEAKFIAATGAHLVLEATPSSQAIRRSTTGPIQATVEILIDGKVAQKSKLVGLWAKCAMEIEY